MSSGLLGKKLGMMSLFSSEGILQPVTVVQVGPCVVTQIKTIATDGYNALQLGFGEKKASRLNKPIAGHLKKSGEGRFAVLQEFPVDKLSAKARAGDSPALPNGTASMAAKIPTAA